jgi:hypothetical protein
MALEDRLDQQAQELVSLKADRDQWRRRHNQLVSEIDRYQTQLGIRTAMQGVALNPPKWQTKKPPKTAKDHHAIAWLMFSDWHLDEVVDVEMMSGINAFDRRIAEIRLKEWVNSVNRVVEIDSASVTYDGAAISVNGDVFSGWIHGLKETNDGKGVFKDTRFWAERLAAAFTALLEVFPKIALYVTVGNHGRLSVKWESKRAISENVEYLLGLFLQDYFAGNDRINVTVAESVDVLFPIYDLTVLQTHGNTGHSGTGGNGQAGIWTMVNKIVANKRAFYQNMKMDFDVLGIGHFHQYRAAAFGRYCDYARDKGYNPEPATQSFARITPERGITANMPLFVANRKREGW